MCQATLAAAGLSLAKQRALVRLLAADGFVIYGPGGGASIGGKSVRFDTLYGLERRGLVASEEAPNMVGGKDFRLTPEGRQLALACACAPTASSTDR